jgi:tripartite-type tricarboxylate transporter receptor subunit TctC
MKTLIAAAAMAAMTLTGSMVGGAALAQDYPERPVMLMVSYGAGGATDFQARIVTMTAGNEDRSACRSPSSTSPAPVAASAGTGSPPRPKPMATRWRLQRSAFHRPVDRGRRDYSTENFEPIANWGADPAVFVVAKDSDFNSMEDVVDYAKENPGKLTFSGAGLFVGHHIAALQLEKAAGVKLAYIPNNKGGAGAMKAVIAGEVLGGVNNLSDAFRAREAGNVKILGVFDLERNDFLPDVPTLKEQGFDIDNASVNFRGVMVPKGTPQPIIDKLAATVPQMFENARVARRMKAGGSPMQIMTREEVQAMWKAREETLKELLADL